MITLAELPNKRFTCSGSMMSLKLGSSGGGVKENIVLFGSVEDLSGLASYPNMIDASVSYSIVLLVLFPLETILAL